MVGVDWLLDINFREFDSTVLKLGNTQTHINKLLMVLFVLYQHFLDGDSRLDFADHH